MAKYSYTPGMEERGLNWIFTTLSTAAGVTKADQTNPNMRAIFSAYKNYFASAPITNEAAQQIVILENLIIPNGTGSVINAVFFYNPNDRRRLPGDNIRFHDGAQDLPVKR
jgi:hypothetical protein